MSETKMEQKARQYLLQDKDRNINVLAALQDGLGRVVAAEDRGCLCCVDECIWQIAADDEKTALGFYAQVPAGATMLEVQNTAQIDLLARHFQPRCIETYYNAWYDGDHIDVPDIGAEVRTLGPENAMELARHYHLPGPSAGHLEETAAYLAERMKTGTVFAVYLEGRLAGFAGTHQEGSMGMLTVLPEYRRRGLGLYLEQLSIARSLERGWLPFGQIAHSNEASLALQRSAGMILSERQVCWMDR